MSTDAAIRRASPGPFGLHRVLEPPGALPQAARRLDPSLPIASTEILIEVDTLNIDSASFHQIVSEVGKDASAVGARISAIVEERGKMQNPVTGSGGMLLGTVREIGPSYGTLPGVGVGRRVATLVSLTLTPLSIRRVRNVRLEADQVEVEGHAVLWAGAPVVAMPADLPERVALACLDVAGAPAQTARMVRPGMRVAVIGAGKSGALCVAQARESLAGEGRVVAVDRSEAALRRLGDAGLVDAWGTCDARDPVSTSARITELAGGRADLVINTANVDGTEMSAILAVRDGGTVYFFNMATSFARAALGAEGVARDATLIIGNGYAPGHAEWTLDLVRRTPFLRDLFGAVTGG